MYDNKLYTIKTLSNLHVGGGDANYSVIDKQVQRDILTNYPTIHSSSFKGAMKEYIKYIFVSEQDLNKEGEVNAETENAGNKTIRTIFGQDPDEVKKKAGHVIFTEVKLLSIPVRTNLLPFMYVTCPLLIKEFNRNNAIYGLDFKMDEFTDRDVGYYADNMTDELTVEEMDYKLANNSSIKVLEKYLGKNIVLLRDDQFTKIVSSLPILARNYLENGESKNLFYEEVVPRESLFYTVLQYPNKNLLSLDKVDTQAFNHIKEFKDKLQNMKFYIGANSSIGYGYCHLEEQDINQVESQDEE